jgi:excisionase family DNA binding protein
MERKRMITDQDFTDEQLLLTTVQAAKVLGVGRTTIYQLIKQGDLHPVHVARCCRISWAELERYVAQLEAAQAVEPEPNADRRWRRVVMPDGQQKIFAGEINGNDSVA